jgi:hypothetical protein
MKTNCLGNRVRVFLLAGCLSPFGFVLTANAQVEIVPIDAMWRYLSPDGAAEDPGDVNPNFDTTWFTAGFNDSSWSGPDTGPFDYGGVNGVVNNPTVNFLVEPPAGDRYTNYFRHQFTTTQRYTNLGFDILADDGAVVYLDGQVVLRFNCCRDSAGNDVDDYLSFTTAGGNEDRFRLERLDEALALNPGNHLLAVSLHQADVNSSDLGMGLRLLANVPPPPPPDPNAVSTGVDTYITSMAKSGPDGSYGGESVWEWDGADGGGVNQGLLWFDIPREKLAAFGADGTATLKLTVEGTGTNGLLHRMSVDWLSGPDGGNNITWNNIPGGPGIVPGTNAVETSNVSTGDRNAGDVMELDVTEDLRAWAGGEPNYGWGILPTGTNGFEVAGFEFGPPDAPQLIVIPGTPIGPALQAGDADQDLDFDQLDLVRVQVAAKYLTGQAATWGQGDWNGAPGGRQGSPPTGDGLFNQRDIIAAQLANKYLMGKYGALAPSDGVRGDGQTSIVYNPSTGEVAVDAPATTQLTSINIDSAASIFTGAPAMNLGGSFDNDKDNNIFKATFGSSFGTLSFGNVAQPGLSKAFVTNDLTVVGSLAGGGALGPVDLIYVPEPSSVVLLAFALVGLAGYGWRRRS